MKSFFLGKRLILRDFHHFNAVLIVTDCALELHFRVISLLIHLTRIAITYLKNLVSKVVLALIHQHLIRLRIGLTLIFINLLLLLQLTIGFRHNKAHLLVELIAQLGIFTVTGRQAGFIVPHRGIHQIIKVTAQIEDLFIALLIIHRNKGRLVLVCLIF